MGFIALLAALSSGSGCTFWGLGGGGPLAKDAAYRYHGRAPGMLSAAQKASYDQLLLPGYWQGIPQTLVTAAGRSAMVRQRTSHDLAALPLLGYWTSRSAVVVGEKDKEARLAGRRTGLAPAFPLAILGLVAWETWYHVDESDEVASREHYGVGPLGLVFGFCRAVQPAALPPQSASMVLCGPARAGRELAATVAGGTDGLRYSSRWAWHILGGALAWGRVNRRCYLQVVWIPLPLWSVAH